MQEFMQAKVIENLKPRGSAYIANVSRVERIGSMVKRKYCLQRRISPLRLITNGEFQFRPL